MIFLKSCPFCNIRSIYISESINMRKVTLISMQATLPLPRPTKSFPQSSHKQNTLWSNFCFSSIFAFWKIECIHTFSSKVSVSVEFKLQGGIFTGWHLEDEVMLYTLQIKDINCQAIEANIVFFLLPQDENRKRSCQMIQ